MRCDDQSSGTESVPGAKRVGDLDGKERLPHMGVSDVSAYETD